MADVVEVPHLKNRVTNLTGIFKTSIYLFN